MNVRTLATVSLGNILEWFDFALFVYLAPMMGAYFFPAHDPVYASMMAFAVFAAGFICRPLGGIVFGQLGDRLGRAKTLTISILTISCSTGMVGLLPSYAQIGWVSPLLFTGLRLIHGLSVGGEYTGAVIYLGESASPQHRGFLASFAIVGANLGFFLATLMAILLNSVVSPSFAHHWGWRLCFLFSGGVGFLILYHRFKLQETAVFTHLRNTRKIAAIPLLTALRHAPGKLLQLFALTCMGSTFYFLFFGYMPNYLAQYFGVSLLKSFSCQALFLLAMLILIPIAGICGDRFGRKKMLLMTAIGIIVFTIPCLYLLQQGTVITILSSLAVASILSSFEQSNNLITFVETCPANVRYSGISFTYNLGNAIFGGASPLIFSWLTHNLSLFASAYYLILMAFISFAAILTLRMKHLDANNYIAIRSSIILGKEEL